MKCNNCQRRKCQGDHRQKCKGFQPINQKFWFGECISKVTTCGWPTTERTRAMILGKGAK